MVTHVGLNGCFTSTQACQCLARPRHNQVNCYLNGYSWSHSYMNHNAHSPETRRRREKCIATSSFTANTAVPMLHRALYSSSFSHEPRTKYMATKTVKGTDRSPLCISSILLVTSPPTPAATLLQFLSSGPVQSFPSPDVVVFFPSLPYPPLPFLVKLFLCTSITSFFIIVPIE